MQNIPQIPIGNSFAISWSITQCEELVSLSGKQIKLTLSHNLDRIEISEFLIEGNTITFQFPGHLQCVTGIYSLSLLVVDSTIHNSWRVSRAFELVSSGVAIPLLTLNSDLAIPRNGMSAYELAVLNGYPGSYDEWVRMYLGLKPTRISFIGISGEVLHTIEVATPVEYSSYGSSYAYEPIGDWGDMTESYSEEPIGEWSDTEASVDENVVSTDDTTLISNP